MKYLFDSCQKFQAQTWDISTSNKVTLREGSEFLVGKLQSSVFMN